VNITLSFPTPRWLISAASCGRVKEGGVVANIVSELNAGISCLRQTLGRGGRPASRQRNEVEDYNPLCLLCVLIWIASITMLILLASGLPG
jgi:hypothetical protein